MYYIHLFENSTAHDAVYNGSDGEYQEPWVAYIEDDETVTYNKHDYSKDYLTFKALENGTFQFSNSGLSYSIDEGKTWTKIGKNTDTPTVKKDDYIMWKGKITIRRPGIGTFSSTGNYEAMGNPYSLLYEDNFEGETDLTGKNDAIKDLFRGSTKLISAENLSLPATTLANSCYYGMFKGCTALAATPELPATTLANNCYASMFNGCTSLATAPELPATTLASYCYSDMFADCTSLTTAPVLPATTLAQGCYTYMFSSCTALTAAPELPVTTLAQNCYGGMFSGCTSLTAAPELPATTLAGSCYNRMFEDCTALATAPELPATTLANSCYYYMFEGCTSLNYIKAMFTTTPSSDYTDSWVSGVAFTGTFVKNSAATWNVTSIHGIPINWTVINENGQPWTVPS